MAMTSARPLLYFVVFLCLLLNAVQIMEQSMNVWRLFRKSDVEEDFSTKGIGYAALDDQSRVLVTGAAGFIGMHTCLQLVRSNDTGGQGLAPSQVVGLDNFDNYYSIDLKKARVDQLRLAGISLRNASVCDAEVLTALFQKHQFTHIIHLAGQAGVRYGRYRPDKYIKSNVECFDVLLESIVKLLPRAYLVYASSSSVYGGNPKTPFSELDRVDFPLSLYGATKRMNELLAFAYFSNYGLHSTGLRFFTVYGEWGRPDMIIFKFSYKIDHSLPVRVFNMGNLSRDFTYVGDIVDGIIKICQYRASPDEKPGVPSFGVPRPDVFNLGNSHPVQVDRVIRIIERNLNKSAHVVDAGQSTGEVETTHADTSKALKLLGWQPRTSIEAGVGKFAAWYRSHNNPIFFTDGDFHLEDRKANKPSDGTPKAK